MSAITYWIILNGYNDSHEIYSCYIIRNPALFLRNAKKSQKIPCWYLLRWVTQIFRVTQRKTATQVSGI